MLNMPTNLYDLVRIREYGERGYLLEQLSDEARVAIERATTLQPPEAFAECVLGAKNVLLLFQRPVTPRLVENWLRSLTAEWQGEQQEQLCIEVPVVYDGADLEEVSARTGLSVDRVIELHTAPVYRVRMIGFTPGFPYLDGLDQRLHLDRKTAPLSRIEPGAVAIGGSHAGIYSVASPGGWYRLGRTELSLFQPEQACSNVAQLRSIFSFAAGDSVKFAAL
jgi:KipI family sensor histidine kinase inhibitor